MTRGYSELQGNPNNPYFTLSTANKKERHVFLKKIHTSLYFHCIEVHYNRVLLYMVSKHHRHASDIYMKLTVIKNN